MMRRFLTLLLVAALAAVPMTAQASPTSSLAFGWAGPFSGVFEVLWARVAGDEVEPAPVPSDEPGSEQPATEPQESPLESEPEVFPGWDPVG